MAIVFALAGDSTITRLPPRRAPAAAGVALVAREVDRAPAAPCPEGARRAAGAFLAVVLVVVPVRFVAPVVRADAAEGVFFLLSVSAIVRILRLSGAFQTVIVNS